MWMLRHAESTVRERSQGNIRLRGCGADIDMKLEVGRPALWTWPFCGVGGTDKFSLSLSPFCFPVCTREALVWIRISLELLKPLIRIHDSSHCV